MIEVARFVNVSSSPFNGDIFDVMAGGASYMQSFAGNTMYNPLIIPQGNPKSVMLNQSIGTVAQMIGIQNDFVELALMPLQINSTLDDYDARVIILFVSDAVIKVINAKYGGGGRGSLGITSGGTLTGSMNLGALAAEMNGDTAMENAAEALGGTIAGPFGSIVAGALVGGLMGGGFNLGENVAEHVTRSFGSIAANKATAGIAGALGLTSVGAAIVGMIAGLAITQAIEVALGLRSGFGFGGQLKGFDSSGQNFGFGTIAGVNSSVHTQYAPQMTFTTALAYAFNMQTSIDNSMTAEARAQDALNSYYSSNPSERGSTGYGSLASMSQQTASEENQRSNNPIGDAASMNDGGENAGAANTGIGDHESGDGGIGGFGRGDGGSGGEGGSGARHCCTVMVRHRLWRKKRLDDLGEWDKKQNVVWRVGYQIGGKMVANFFNKPNRLGYYSKMMDAFYDTHILGKPRTHYAIQAYVWIYPIVYITGAYNIACDYIGVVLAKNPS